MMSNSKPVSFENKDKYVELGLNIAFYRKHAGLTQEELAERAGLSHPSLLAGNSVQHRHSPGRQDQQPAGVPIRR